MPGSPLDTPFFGRKINMLNCMRCGKELLGIMPVRNYRRKNYLCVPCIKETKDDVKEILKYKHKYERYQNKLKKYKEENIKKMTFSGQSAEKIMRGIAESVFNFKVLKEVIFEPYIIDFVVQFNSIKIGIEIDGGIHNDQLDYDEKRDQVLSARFDLPIFRFTNDIIQTDDFVKAIWNICYKINNLQTERINKIAKIYGISF